MSQSPRIGAIIRITSLRKRFQLRNFVSIPSNRGNHSNTRTPMAFFAGTACLNPLESGQSFELKIKVNEREFDLRLNPLESGQSFEF